jgi:LmbE family N-acetylglucosaminyl deacetylase
MPSTQLTLLAVLAHPDDESLGFGGTLAKYSAEGVATHLLTATRGEAGRNGVAATNGPAELGHIREAELRAASAVLGVRELNILGYPDGALDHVPPSDAVGAIAAHIRRIQPHVVLTFGPEGAYGHPDHIAISQFTTAATICAAGATHRVAKLYYLAWRANKWNAYQAALRKLTSTVDGVERQATPWPDWAVTTTIDTSAHWPTVWKAVCCHQTQMSIYERLRDNVSLTEDHQRSLWGSQEFYRAYSTVNGGANRKPTSSKA